MRCEPYAVASLCTARAIDTTPVAGPPPAGLYLAFGAFTLGDQPRLGRSVDRGSSHRAAGSSGHHPFPTQDVALCGLDD